MGKRLVVCVETGEYRPDLKKGNVYEAIPDVGLGPDDIRVIDGSGEDYVYPADWFVPAQGREEG